MRSCTIGMAWSASSATEKMISNLGYSWQARRGSAVSVEASLGGRSGGRSGGSTYLEEASLEVLVQVAVETTERTEDGHPGDRLGREGCDRGRVGPAVVTGTAAVIHPRW